MLYYKVKGEYDQQRRQDGSILIGGELYTKKEMERYGISHNFVTPIEVPKSNIYWFFGARWAN